MIGIKPGNQHTEDTEDAEVTGGFGEEPRDRRSLKNGEGSVT